VGCSNVVAHSVACSLSARGSAPISDRTLDIIRRSIPLIDVVGAVVSLRRAGRRLIGLCPFHSERHPSFGIDPERNLWFCFGCGAGGDAITFIQRLEGCDFRKAVGILAARFGISIQPGTVDRSRLALREELRGIDERIKEILRRERIRCADELERLREICRRSDLDSLPADVHNRLRRADARYVLVALQRQEDTEEFLAASPAEQEKRIDEALNDGYVRSGTFHREVPCQ
jgi:hypothetical protein